MKNDNGAAWEIKYGNVVVGRACSHDAAVEIAHPHDNTGRFLEDPLRRNISICPMLTDDANNYFSDLAKDFFGADADCIDGSTLIRCGRWLDKHYFMTIDTSGRIWADDFFVGEVFVDDFRNRVCDEDAYDAEPFG